MLKKAVQSLLKQFGYQPGEKSKHTVLIGIIVLAFFSIWPIYGYFGPLLVKAAYNGKSICILNSLIRYQYKKPLEHYLRLADGLFYDIWILLGLALAAVITIRTFLVFDKSLAKISQLPDTSQTQFAASDIHCYRRHILTLFLLSLAVRAIFLPALADLPTAGDETYYWSVHRFLADGDFSSTLVRPPLWGYMLTIPVLISERLIAARAFAVLIGSCTTLLI